MGELKVVTDSHDVEFTDASLCPEDAAKLGKVGQVFIQIDYYKKLHRVGNKDRYAQFSKLIKEAYSTMLDDRGIILEALAAAPALSPTTYPHY